LHRLKTLPGKHVSFVDICNHVRPGRTIPPALQRPVGPAAAPAQPDV